jgi:hypothetical protein
VAPSKEKKGEKRDKGKTQKKHGGSTKIPKKVEMQQKNIKY